MGHFPDRLRLADPGPGFNQTPHQDPYSPRQQLPQSYGGHTTGLSYSASISSSYSNATASWKKQQTGVMGLAKDTVDNCWKGDEEERAGFRTECVFCFLLYSCLSQDENSRA